ncbi:MAG: hypothetical protein EOP04_09290 [Proteobacteria bacterium]|nr:MAG: hypothetical protein EOP04_09290 [Pseudomonadota bacterium]
MKIDEALKTEVDQLSGSWSQGDCALGDLDFFYQTNPESPLDSSNVGEQFLAKSVIGICLLTQTCDVVRSCGTRQFLEFSPLIEVDQRELEDIRTLKRPGYAYVKGVAELKLVADLDRVMTLDKSMLKMLVRTPGCVSDDQRRSFACALARKRARFAFPDDFHPAMSKLVERLKKRSGKQSEEGYAIANLREIRVKAEPSWDSPNITLTFLFIKDETVISFSEINWIVILDDWLKLVPNEGRYVESYGTFATLDDFTAREYVESDVLDLDQLSVSKEE